jgi:serine protease Do
LAIHHNFFSFLFITMKNKPMLAAVVLVGIGVVLGVGLVTMFERNTFAELYAQAKQFDIGAKQVPVKVESSALVLNNAFKAVSKSVNQSGVSITVTTERKADPRRRQLEDFFGFRSPQQEGEEGEGFSQRGSGSGVFITTDGYIVTNNHVVADAKKVGGLRVMTSDKHEYDAKLVGRDELTDLAVIKIEPRSGEQFSPAFIGNSDAVQVGEWCVAVGNPFGLESTVTAGIVSAISRGSVGLRRDARSVENFIQTDAAINPGNSGGGLFDLEGKLIGINTAIATQNGGYQGYGFAIPSNLMRAVALDLMDDGKINRGYIGVSITPLDESTAKAVGLGSVAGAMVQDLTKDGAAKNAGIEIGDVILEVDGFPIGNSSELQSRIAMRRAGDKVSLTIWRNKQRISRSVTLKAQTEPKDLAENDTEDEKNSTASKGEGQALKPLALEKLGMTVAPLDDDAKKKLEANGGVLVTKIVPYGIAQQAFIRPGSVIVKAGGVALNSPQQFKDLLEGKKAGEAILLQVKFINEGTITTRLVGIEIPRNNG